MLRWQQHLRSVSGYSGTGDYLGGEQPGLIIIVLLIIIVIMPVCFPIMWVREDKRHKLQPQKTPSALKS